jgi:hypothetical protein
MGWGELWQVAERLARKTLPRSSAVVTELSFKVFPPDFGAMLLDSR